MHGGKASAVDRRRRHLAGVDFTSRHHGPSPKLPNNFQGRPPGTSNMQENFSAAGSSPQTLLVGAYSAPPDPIAGGVGGGLVPSERDWLDPHMLGTEAPRWISKEGSK